MAKKVESKVVETKDVTALSFFECQNLITEINMLAEKNEGEISDEQINALIEAQTQTPAKLYSLCNFLKMMETHIRICKDRKKEINETQKHGESILERMEARVAVWVESQGKHYHCQEYELSTRLSKSVQLVEGFEDPFYCTIKMERIVTPDKAAIKKALEAGEKIEGATLVEKVNLTIK